MELYSITYRPRFERKFVTVTEKGVNVKDAIERLEQKGVKGIIYDCTWIDRKGNEGTN